MRAYVPQLARLTILLGVIGAALAAAFLTEDAADALVIGVGAGFVVAVPVAVPLALDHQLDVKQVPCDPTTLSRMNIAAAEIGFAIAHESDRYIRYEDVETPVVGFRAFGLPQLNIVVQFSENKREVTIVGPTWHVNRLKSAAQPAPR